MTEFRTKKPTLPKAFLLLLLALAALGNYLEISLFFGVDFIFGSIFVLIAVAMYGPFWGFLLSIVPAIELYYLWGHPYAVIAPLGEAVFVGNFLKRYQTNLVLSGMVYWIFIGIPLIFSLYLIGLKMDPGDALLAALKSGSNGVVNSICASLIVTYVPWLYRPLGHPDRGITLFETLFNSFIAVTLIPIFTLLTIDARRGVGEMEQNIKGHLSEIGTALSLSIEAWKGEQIRSIEMLANVIEKENGNNTDSMQLWLEQHQRIWGNFLGAFVTDQHGITIAFDPLRNIKGESTIGLSFADRQYFQAMKRGEPSPHVSSVFMARGGVFQPVFNVTSRIRRGGKFSGIVTGSMNLNDISQLLKSVPLGVDYFAIVIDADGRVISSTSSDFRPLEKYKNFDAIMDHTGKSQVYHRWP